MGAWDRDLVEQDFRIGQAEAFADAVAIFGEHLRAGQTNSNEAAALLNWLHGRTGPAFIDDVGGAGSLIETFHRELSDCADSILLEMVQSLDGPNFRQGVGTSEFAAVLDLSTLGGIAGEVDADVIVTAYGRSISTGSYTLSAHRIGVASAAALARISEQTTALRSRFLYPLDVRARLGAATSQDNEFTLADSIGLSLRTHIRILCRAVVGGPRMRPQTSLMRLSPQSVQAHCSTRKRDASPRFPLGLSVAYGEMLPIGPWPLT